MSGPPPLAILCSMATRTLLEWHAARWRAPSGAASQVHALGGAEAARRVEAGEVFDVVVLAAEATDRLVAQGRLRAPGRLDWVRSGIAAATPAGAPPPDLRSEAAVREAVLRAGRIGISSGPSARAMAALFARWGLEHRLAPRLRQTPPGVGVGSLLAAGEADLGFQQLGELQGIRGTTVAGLLPPEIQVYTTFCAAVHAASSRPDDAGAFVAGLRHPSLGPAAQARGLDMQD